MKLRPTAETDAALRDHIETTHWIDETGELDAPTTVLPEIPGWGIDGPDDDGT